MENTNMQKKFEFIVNTTREFMTMIDRDYRYVAANNAYCEAHGKSRDEIMGKSVKEVWGTERNRIIQAYLEECFRGREVSYESWFNFPAMGYRCYEVCAYPFWDNDKVTHVVVVSRDVTERKELEKKVFVDPLTRVYNYRYISQRMTEELERANRYNLSLSLLFADIDYFKKINDTIGHTGGNEVLKHLAGILNNSSESSTGPTLQLRRSDIVARFGGEEFIVLLPETPKKDAGTLAERIRSTVEEYNFPHLAKNPDARITVSIGVSAYPTDNIENAGDLLKKADLAMYEAKNEGRNRVKMFAD